MLFLAPQATGPRLRGPDRSSPLLHYGLAERDRHWDVGHKNADDVLDRPNDKHRRRTGQQGVLEPEQVQIASPEGRSGPKELGIQI